jgi:hypothetical protein
VTYKPYIELGDAGQYGASDQMVVAWQTDEAEPQPSAYRVELGETMSYGRAVAPNARVVDNYLPADPSLPVPPTAPGPHANYTAVLNDLQYDTEYFYRVTGPGLTTEGFASSFHTRKRGRHFSFLVPGDEGFFLPPCRAPIRRG